MSVIPKLDNLSLPTNYRDIQMQPLLANLYDRILANRLICWVKVSDCISKRKRNIRSNFYFKN